MIVALYLKSVDWLSDCERVGMGSTFLSPDDPPATATGFSTLACPEAVSEAELPSSWSSLSLTSVFSSSSFFAPSTVGLFLFSFFLFSGCPKLAAAAFPDLGGMVLWRWRLASSVNSLVVESENRMMKFPVGTSRFTIHWIENRVKIPIFRWIVNRRFEKWVNFINKRIDSWIENRVKILITVVPLCPLLSFCP